MSYRVNLHISIFKARCLWIRAGTRACSTSSTCPNLSPCLALGMWRAQLCLSLGGTSPWWPSFAPSAFCRVLVQRVQWRNRQCHTLQDYNIYITSSTLDYTIRHSASHWPHKNMACLVQSQACLLNRSLQPRCSFVNHDCLSYPLPVLEVKRCQIRNHPNASNRRGHSWLTFDIRSLSPRLFQAFWHDQTSINVTACHGKAKCTLFKSQQDDHSCWR